MAPTRSASADSAIPVVRTERERTTAPDVRAASRGSTSSASSPRISDGTPGSTTTTRPRLSSTPSPRQTGAQLGGVWVEYWARQRLGAVCDDLGLHLPTLGSAG